MLPRASTVQRKGGTSLSIRSGLALAAVGALALGLLVSAGLESLATPDRGDPLRVPVGRVGDEVTYAYFQRDAQGAGFDAAIPPEAEWRLVESEEFSIRDVTRTLDGDGAARQAVIVASNHSNLLTFEANVGFGGPSASAMEATRLTEYDYVELEGRISIRTDVNQAKSGGRKLGDNLTMTFFVVKLPDLAGLQYQGLTLELDQDLTAFNRPKAGHPLYGWVLVAFRFPSLLPPFGQTVSSLQPLLGESLPDPLPEGTEFRSWVADRAFVNEHDAYGVVSEATLKVPGEFRAEDARDAWMESLRGSTLRLTRTDWVTPDLPYVVASETAATLKRPGESERLLAHHLESLAVYKPGNRQAIPWTGSPADPVGPGEDLRLERQLSSLGAPVDGAGSRLPYPLGQAVSDVQGDLSLLQYQLWRQQHPNPYLIAAKFLRGESSRSGAESYQWNLVFGVPAGDAYEVSAERRPGVERPIVREWDNPSKRPFSPSDMPAQPLTLAAAERAWTLVAAKVYQDKTPSYVRWGLDWDYHQGVACPLPSHEGPRPHTDPALHFKVLYFGYTTSGSCVEAANPWSEAALVLNLETGRPVWSYHVQTDFDYHGLPFSGPPRRPVPVAHTLPPELRPPTVEKTALASGSIFFAIAAVYFLPLLQFASLKTLLLLPGYSKLFGIDLGANKIREQLLEAIRNNPGIHASELKRRIDAGWGTIVYHLSVLERNKMVSSLVDGRHKRFFPIGVIDWSRRGQLAVLMHDTTKRLYELILETPGSVQGELASHVGLTVPTTIWHLKRLEDAGLVGRDKKGRRVHYYANPDAPAPEPYDPNQAVEVA